MRKLLVIGAGGHGKVVADAALASGWDDVAFLDDKGAAAGTPLGRPIIGPVDDLAKLFGDFDAAVVAIGEAAGRLRMIEQCQLLALQIPTIVHPSAAVSRFARLADGCVVFAQAAVNADAELGVGCIVNTGATVDHDCRLGRGVHVCPGTHIAGSVRVGDRSWIGIGAVVRQGITIGRDVTVAAGAVVVSDVPNEVTVMGVPAREKKGVRA